MATNPANASPCGPSAARTLLGSLIVALAVAFAAPALAQEPTEAELAEARHSFELARRAFDAGDYDTAADEFRAAHALMRHPDLLFNVYLAEERAGRSREAADALAGYLDGATIAPDQRSLLDARLARLRARIERAERGAVETESAEDELALRAPLALEGAPDEAPETDERATDVGASRSSGGGPPVAAVATLVVAAVLAASFAALAVVSEVEDGALASECGRDAGRWCSEDRVRTLEAVNIAADASWIAAAAVGVVGVVLLFALPPDGESTQVAVAPWASPEGAGMSAGGRF